MVHSYDSHSLELASLNGCIFGWILVGSKDMPIAHHTGLILEWNNDNPLNSIIGHYGIDSQPLVIVEKLGAAAIRSQVPTVYINPHYKASFNELPFSHDKDINEYIPSNELLEYEASHPNYDIWLSNCQHFVQHFVGNIGIESDWKNNVAPLTSSLIRASIFGSDDDILALIGHTVSSYVDYRKQGVCQWDHSLDIHL